TTSPPLPYGGQGHIRQLKRQLKKKKNFSVSHTRYCLTSKNTRGEKSDPSAATLLHQFQHEEEDPKHQKGTAYISLSVACPHLIGCSPRASSPRPGMGSDLARIYSCTCAHYLFTS
ncbi:mCG1046327, partial [Mus musculus]